MMVFPSKTSIFNQEDAYFPLEDLYAEILDIKSLKQESKTILNKLKAFIKEYSMSFKKLQVVKIYQNSKKRIFLVVQKSKKECK